MGTCPGNEENEAVNYSHRNPEANRQMLRVLNQAANAAVKAKGTIFALVYRRLVPRLGHAQAIGAIAHRLCRLIWKITGAFGTKNAVRPSTKMRSKRTRAMIPRTPTPGISGRPSRNTLPRRDGFSTLGY